MSVRGRYIGWFQDPVPFWPERNGHYVRGGADMTWYRITRQKRANRIARRVGLPSAWKVYGYKDAWCIAEDDRERRTGTKPVFESNLMSLGRALRENDGSSDV